MDAISIERSSFEELKHHYDTTLNKDKTSFRSSNDEPTPIGCIQEILEAIPSEFWSRGDLRIMDPCCGNGNWHLVVWDILKKRHHKSDDAIFESFFFNDINDDRLDVVRRVFRGETNELNISRQDFLAESDPGARKYDLIMANPPYAKLMKDGKRASKNHTLIRDFMERSLELLNDDGYMAYLIPDNWMSLADRNSIVKALTRTQLVHLDIHSAKKWFPKIGSSFTWVVLRKSAAQSPFRVTGVYKQKPFRGYVESQPRDYIPLIYTDLVRSILNKTIDRKGWTRFAVQTSSDLHKFTKKCLISTENDAEHPYRLIHTPKQTVYCSRPHKYQEGYKVFISLTDTYRTFVDDCGMTQSIAFIRCEDEDDAHTKKRTLDHNLFRFINDICRWGNFNNVRVLQRFPVPTNPDDVYESFGLTDSEVEFVEAMFSK